MEGRKWMIRLFVMIMSTVASGFAAADSRPETAPRTVEASDGRSRFMILPLRAPFTNGERRLHPGALGVFIRAMGSHGHEGKRVFTNWMPFWYRNLLNDPEWAIVSTRFHMVATIDTYGQKGPEHALVIYGQAEGSFCAVLVDYSLGQLLTEEELKSKVERSVSSIRWANVRSAQFDREEKYFSIETNWGRRIKVEIAKERQYRRAGKDL